MKNIVSNFLKITFFVFGFSFISYHAQAADVVRNYIKQYSELVKSLSEEFGIPTSIITAISIVESGAGKSRTARLLNNHFGVVGKNKLMKTKGIKTKYKQYTSAEQSFREFCKMISRKKYYAKLKNNNNHKLWVEAMAKAGYSTQPEVWKKEILRAIKLYRLGVTTN